MAIVQFCAQFHFHNSFQNAASSVTQNHFVYVIAKRACPPVLFNKESFPTDIVCLTGGKITGECDYEHHNGRCIRRYVCECGMPVLVLQVHIFQEHAN